MTVRSSPLSVPSKDLLVTLQKTYGDRIVGCDVFGRRVALPSEIARHLAQSAADNPAPRPCEDSSGPPTLAALISAG